MGLDGEQSLASCRFKFERRRQGFGPLGVITIWVYYIPVVDEHGAGWRAVFGQLPVTRARRHQGQLDRVERVGIDDLHVEAGIHHRRLKRKTCVLIG